jgi:hypothetical protein
MGVKRKRRCWQSRRATARAATLISGPPAHGRAFAARPATASEASAMEAPETAAHMAETSDMGDTHAVGETATSKMGDIYAAVACAVISGKSWKRLHWVMSPGQRRSRRGSRSRCSAG